jgi:type IV pilus assembly protein PilM
MADRSTPRPPLACEITQHRVLAARANSAHDAADAVSVRILPEGALALGITGSNLQRSGTVRDAVAQALADVSPHGQELTLVLPDSVVRVMLLEFDTLPEKPQDAASLIRFRLKKLLPFDSDSAAVSYQVQRGGTPIQVLAAMTQAAVLQEYEALVSEIGFNAGVVLPSILAALGPVDGSVPTLVVKAEIATTAVAIVDRGEVRLVRTIETLTPAASSPERLAEDIYPSLVYFQDTYGTQVERMMLGGTAADQSLRAALEQQSGMQVMDLVAQTELPVGTSLDHLPRAAFAGVIGALVTQ